MFLETYTNVITMEIDGNFSGAFINEHFEKDIICHISCDIRLRWFCLRQHGR